MKYMPAAVWGLLFLASIGYGGETNLSRVASLAPSLTETMFQLGCGHLLVGRSSSCKYPAAAQKVPVIGEFSIPSMEKLAEVKPDLIIADNLRDPGMAETFAALGIRYCRLPSRCLADYFRNVETLGKLLHCEDRAAAEITRVRGALAAVEQRYRDLPTEKRPKVLIVIWDDPLITCGRKSFLNDYLRLAGARNLAENENVDYFKCSLEWAVAHDPDILIFPGLKKDKLMEVVRRPGWAGLRAVKEGRVYCDLDNDLLFTLGPRIPEGLKLLENCINGKKP